VAAAGAMSFGVAGTNTYTAVPEPSTLALFAVAGLGFTEVTARRRRRR